MKNNILEFKTKQTKTHEENGKGGGDGNMPKYVTHEELNSAVKDINHNIEYKSKDLKFEIANLKYSLTLNMLSIVGVLGTILTIIKFMF